MAEVVRPASLTELASLVAEAAQTRQPVAVQGKGTKQGLGRPMQTSATLDLSGFTGIGFYEPEELVLEAGAGTMLREIEDAVAANNQQLAFEPPDLSHLMSAAHAGTLGGILSCNLSGPRRLKAGAARDFVLGIAGVSGRGEAFKAGARVVKNVTGYDLPKLLAGSYGTLAALTTITLKVLPRPETEQTLVVRGLRDHDAVRAMSMAMQSSCEVSGAAHVSGISYLRLEGIRESVIYRRDRLAKLLGEFGRIESLDAVPSQVQWQSIRDVAPLDGADRIVWRLAVTPSEAPDVTARIAKRIDARWFFDWAGGLVWLDVPPMEDGGAAIIRGAIGQGHATLVRAPKRVRRVVEVFHPQPPALAALSARVKLSFDPAQILNPGRMYQGV